MGLRGGALRGVLGVSGGWPWSSGKVGLLADPPHLGVLWMVAHMVALLPQCLGLGLDLEPFASKLSGSLQRPGLRPGQPWPPSHPARPFAISPDQCQTQNTGLREKQRRGTIFPLRPSSCPREPWALVCSDSHAPEPSVLCKYVCACLEGGNRGCGQAMFLTCT